MVFGLVADLVLNRTALRAHGVATKVSSRKSVTFGLVSLLACNDVAGKRMKRCLFVSRLGIIKILIMVYKLMLVSWYLFNKKPSPLRIILLTPF
jgi:hypothetical protein